MSGAKERKVGKRALFPLCRWLDQMSQAVQSCEEGNRSQPIRQTSCPSVNRFPDRDPPPRTLLSSSPERGVHLETLLP